MNSSNKSLVVIQRINTAVISRDFSESSTLPKMPDKNGGKGYDLNFGWKTISQRLEVTNELIDKLENSYKDLIRHVSEVELEKRNPIYFQRYLMDSEILIGTLKTSADQLLTLLGIVENKAVKGFYSLKIERDKIGAYINGKKNKSEHLAFLDRHSYMLRELNDAANSYKHSFLNLYVNTYNSEPSVLVYNFPNNDLNKPGSLESISFENTISEYNDFLSDIGSKIIELSKKINRK